MLTAVAVEVARSQWTPPWPLLWLPQLAAAMTSVRAAAIAAVITAVIGHRFFDRRYCRHRSYRRIVHHHKITAVPGIAVCYLQ
jgi:hypothetical protein